MLDFQKQIVSELVQEDGLVIMARGLGLETIISNMIRAFATSKNLVFILNAHDEDEEVKYISMASIGLQKKHIPISIKAGFSHKDRKTIYSNGGCLFITSRILIVDILAKRLADGCNVSGIFLLNAHKISEDSNEVFIIKFLRQKNPSLFVKAFSDNEYPFSTGFLKLQKMVDMMFLKKVFLWPRFRAEVVKSLEKHSPQLVEVSCKLTKNMKLIQDSIVDLIRKSVEEIKKFNQDNAEFHDLDMDNFLLKSFDFKMKHILMPNWERVGKKTKGLLEDIRLMKNLLNYVLRNDCYSFLKYLENIAVQQERLEMPTSNWILTDDAQMIFLAAKERVYLVKSSVKKTKKEVPTSTVSEEGITLVLEENPKWKLINKILEEIKREVTRSKDPKLNSKVLIITKTDHCVMRIKEYLSLGKEMMMNIFYHYQLTLDKRETNNVDANKYIKPIIESPVKRQISNNPADLLKEKFKTQEKPHVIEIKDDDDSGLDIQVQTFYQVNLEVTRPSWIILYEGEISTIRSLEVFKSLNPGFPMRIYFLRYEESIEEQIYKNSIKSELKNFKTLIQENSRLIPTERIVDVIQPVELTGKSQTVVVDVREFRGSLPPALHEAGFNVVPLSIGVGDFIVTPKLCLERKSPPDLIQSLTHGRLFTQAERMLKYYDKACVLITFEENESFQLINEIEIRERIQMALVTSKLALLTIHFPRLKIFWSRSPAHSVKLIQTLKKDQAEPDPVLCQSLGENEIEESPTDSAIDFLKKLPGVTPQNINILIDGVGSLRDLSNMSYANLFKFIGKQNAILLYDFFNQDYFTK